ncbi:MAG: hypothetical protein HOH66_03335 [Rhodospirillaceae bacterium]|nr:hypothetical protein [Rhodospirillaceae bacterium]
MNKVVEFLDLEIAALSPEEDLWEKTKEYLDKVIASMATRLPNDKKLSNDLESVREKLEALRPPVDDIEDFWTPMEKARVSAMLACGFHGTADSLADQLAPFIKQTGADELMIACSIYDHPARVHSYEILADVQRKLEGE